MKVDFIFSEGLTDCELYEDLNPEKTEKGENNIISQNELKTYCDIAEDVLKNAEKDFPFFAQETGSAVSVLFTNNDSIHVINKEQRDVDRPTDVLSFPYLELHEGDGRFSEYDLDPETGAIMLGDLVVSIDKVREQAEEYGHSEKRELAFLICHGFLHLMGFDHMVKEDEEKMMARADKILKGAGYGRDQ